MQKLLILALAGSVGTLSRYFLAGVVYKTWGMDFPWGTFAVNILGCFLAGFFWAFFETRAPEAVHLRLYVLVGFMGAFTTFSAFILESGDLILNNKVLLAAVNLSAQNLVGLFALFLGLALGRYL